MFVPEFNNVMIQVLERAENILVYLAENRGRAVSLSEIADTLGMNRGTCANILKTLKELDLIEQISYRSGYALGRKIYQLANAEYDPYRLKSLIQPLIDSLCKEVNENVMLTVIRNDKRIHLYKAEAKHAIQAKVIYDEMVVWEATTAKVIIARYSDDKLNDFLKLAGMPGRHWPEVRTKEDLKRQLADIRSCRCYTVINNHFACMATPIFKNNEVVASIGYYLPDMRLTAESKKFLEDRLAETADKADSILNQNI